MLYDSTLLTILIHIYLFFTLAWGNMNTALIWISLDFVVVIYFGKVLDHNFFCGIFFCSRTWDLGVSKSAWRIDITFSVKMAFNNWFCIQISLLESLEDHTVSIDSILLWAILWIILILVSCRGLYWQWFL